MGKIEYLYEFVNLIDRLINKLYIHEYFGFEDSCLNYADKIYQFIEENIELSNHLKTPNDLSYLGEFYIFYKPNPRTTWFILFDKEVDDFLFTYIFNNHSKEASFL